MLVATAPGEGHVNPMAPVARELVRRGHEVRWYTGRAYRAKVERLGARFEPMRAAYDYGGMSREEAFPHHAGLTGIKGMTAGFRDAFLEPAPDQMRDILDLLETFPADILVTDETTFGAGFVRERTGIPLVWVATSIYLLSSRDTAPLGLGLRPSSSPWGRARNALLRWMANNLVMAELRRHGDVVRARAGLAPLPGGAFENIVRPPDLYLMGTVPSFEYPRGDLLPQTRFVGPFLDPPPEPFEPPAWWADLTAGRPVLHVTQGTVANDPDRLLLPTLRAFAGQDVLVVATTGVPPDRLRLSSLPSNARVERFIPHGHLLPHVDVMVTNGGYGGVNTALAHGVPLLVTACTEEKHEVAAHVAWVGAGIHLRSRRPREAQIRQAVTRLLCDPRYRQRARALRDEYRRYDGPRQAADLIEELADNRRISQEVTADGGSDT
ncbi:Glycosyltransferase [Carbonactinospora thermoautotrophica]|uniref:Glycosyltransferase n=1 Tax=Carbonactinospora thermoautotrophica TaxID=1469144 RepID=A0A132MSN1_9ACTN|nr:Glycosyltransferase [Carbonactinospora thermoautotrophica]